MRKSACALRTQTRSEERVMVLRWYWVMALRLGSQVSEKKGLFLHWIFSQLQFGAVAVLKMGKLVNTLSLVKLHFAENLWERATPNCSGATPFPTHSCFPIVLPLNNYVLPFLLSSRRLAYCLFSACYMCTLFCRDLFFNYVSVWVSTRRRMCS